MVVNDNGPIHPPTEPNPRLTELTERLSGKWRIKGPEIDGKAQYKSMRGGLLLVMNVEFVCQRHRNEVIQHVFYDQDTDSLQAHYMDTMGDESTYTWVLDGQKLRVGLGDKEADTFFEASSWPYSAARSNQTGAQDSDRPLPEREGGARGRGAGSLDRRRLPGQGRRHCRRRLDGDRSADRAAERMLLWNDRSRVTTVEHVIPAVG